MVSGAGKILILVGILLVVAGMAVSFNLTIPWLGRLPGDFAFKKGNFSFYFPLATCLVISLALTLIVSLFKK